MLDVGFYSVSGGACAELDYLRSVAEPVPDSDPVLVSGLVSMVDPMPINELKGCVAHTRSLFFVCASGKVPIRNLKSQFQTINATDYRYTKAVPSVETFACCV